MAKSERERIKQAQKRAEVKKKMNKINKYVLNLENQKETYLDKASEAKKRGEAQTYRLAKSGLNNTMSQLKRAREMQLNLELTGELKNMSASTAEFLETMGVLAKSISKINKSQDYKKLNKSIQSAIEGMQKTGINLESMMEGTSDSFESLASVSGSLSDRELDRLIDGEITEFELSADASFKTVSSRAKAQGRVLTAANRPQNDFDLESEKDTRDGIPPFDDGGKGF